MVNEIKKEQERVNGRKGRNWRDNFEPLTLNHTFQTRQTALIATLDFIQAGTASPAAFSRRCRHVRLVQLSHTFRPR